MGDLMYLENIQEYIEDCNIIVTYKWLSRKLEIPVNTAKQMLHAYLQTNSSVNVTYVVSGIMGSEAGKEFRVCLVKKEELQSMMEMFEQVMGVHVFSVHKTQLKDAETLYRSNYEFIKEYLGSYSRWSTIDCVCEDRSRSESNKIAAGPLTKPAPKPASKTTPKTTTTVTPKTISTAKPKATSSVTPKTTPTSTKPCATAPTATSSKSIGSKQQTSSTNTNEPAAPPKKASEKKTSSQKNTLFSTLKKVENEGKQTDKKESSLKKAIDKEEEKVKTSEYIPSDDEDTQVMDVDSFPEPGRSDETTTTCPSSRNDEHQQVSKKADNLKKSSSLQHRSLQFLDDADVDDEDSDEDSQSNVSKCKEKKKQKKKGSSKVSKETTKSSKRLSSSKHESSEKKRKRVIELSSDEEEAMETSNEKKAQNGVKRRKRVKKMVSKMYVNDDGEMVTEKVWESESTEASEEETPVAAHSTNETSQNSPSHDPPTTQPKLKKKQSHLFRFMKNN